VHESSENENNNDKNVGGTKPVRVSRRRVRHKKDITPDCQSQEKHMRKSRFEEEVVMEVLGKPGSLMRKWKTPPVSGIEDLEAEVEVLPKTRTMAKTKAYALTDTDDDDIHERLLSAQNLQPTVRKEK
jgi:hypothetical protein